jgi:outer membrane immunogenic protein
MRLKSLLLATASSLALATSAAAADLPLKAAPAAVPALTWTGFYVGLNVGVARHDWSMTDANAWVFDSGTFWTSNQNGFTGGVQVGYNWQSGSFVYGFEADFNWLGGVSKEEAPFDVPSIVNGTPLEVHAVARAEWLSTFRGRMGLTTLNPTMVYITGGLAVAGMKNRWGGGYLSANPIGCGCDFNDNKIRFGWTAGFGVEHMINRNWSFKAEMLYVDLGTTSVSVFSPGNGTYRSEFANSMILGRIGLNWRW